MGTYAKDTYETGSRAALAGGTTTLIEMCCPARTDGALESFDLWMSQAVGKSACDFSFHMGVTKFDDVKTQIQQIVAQSKKTTLGQKWAEDFRKNLQKASAVKYQAGYKPPPTTTSGTTTTSG